MKRVAAIDCGTNSLRLLIASADDSCGGPRGAGAAPQLRTLLRRNEVVRLGEGVDATGEITAEAMSRALRVITDYARQCDEHEVEDLRFVATSASRDARNAAEFVQGVRACFPGREVTPEVITGAEEARLSFLGATSAVAAAGHRAGYLVVDLGGGSTEFVRGDLDVRAALSVDLGCVRLTERFLRDDPPTPAQITAVRAAAQVALDQVESRVGFAGVHTLVGLAGTVTTLTAHVRGLEIYTHDQVHLAELPCEETLAACEELVRMPRAERAALPWMHPGRVDVIAAGCVIWAAIVERARAATGIDTVVTSVNDILDGIALDLADAP